MAALRGLRSRVRQQQWQAGASAVAAGGVGGQAVIDDDARGGARGGARDDARGANKGCEDGGGVEVAGSGLTDGMGGGNATDHAVSGNGEFGDCVRYEACKGVEGPVLPLPPLLLMTDLEAGHFAASGASDRLKQKALKMAFIMRSLGVEW